MLKQQQQQRKIEKREKQKPKMATATATAIATAMSTATQHNIIVIVNCRKATTANERRTLGTNRNTLEPSQTKANQCKIGHWNCALDSQFTSNTKKITIYMYAFCFKPT